MPRIFLLGLLVLLALPACGRIGYRSRDTGGSGDDVGPDAAVDASLMDAPDAQLPSDAGPVDSPLMPMDSPDAIALSDSPDSPPDSSEPDADCRCGRNATCTVGLGCVCNAGYAGDGVTCLSTRWATGSLEAYVKASNTGAGDAFGRLVVSGDGNTLAVSAFQEDTSGSGINPPSDEAASDSGAVYIYTRSGGTWTFQAFLKPSNTGSDDAFGFGLALSADGNTLAASSFTEDTLGSGVAPVPNDSATNSGAVYIFRRTAGLWAEQAFIKASNAGSRDAFGFALALSGDGNTLAVGAPFEASSGTGIDPVSDELANNSGAAYVYERVGATWMFRHFIKASNTGASDSFGVVMAISDDGSTLAIGASGEDGSGTGIGSASDEAANGAGAVYVYVRSGPTWVLQAYVKASNTGMSDDFGYTIALSANGDTLAVGAAFESSGGPEIGSTPNEASFNSGAVYLYVRTGAAWAFEAFVKASNPDPDDRFGAAVSLSRDGRILAVGASQESSSSVLVGSIPDEGASQSGAAYVYLE